VWNSSQPLVHERDNNYFIDLLWCNTRNVDAAAMMREDKLPSTASQGETEVKQISLLVPMAVVWALVGGTAAADPKPISPDAKVYIIWPPDGQVIPGGKFWVRMGLSGPAGVAPAGIEKANTGHHHLLVDTDLPPLDQEIPNDKNHLHYGRGQTEAHLELPPGRHTLQLLFADDSHVPHNPPLYSKKITIVVPP
jgi:uncharacterized protein DUF4399